MTQKGKGSAPQYAADAWQAFRVGKGFVGDGWKIQGGKGYEPHFAAASYGTDGASKGSGPQGQSVYLFDAPSPPPVGAAHKGTQTSKANTWLDQEPLQ